MHANPDMSSAESSISAPACFLEEEVQSAYDFLVLLRQEQSKLIDANIHELESLTEKKSHLVAQLSHLAGSRHEALAATGYLATESGMQYWIETKGDSALASKWQILLGIMRDAQEVNRTNGLLINTHLGNNQLRLNALQPSDDKGDNLYGPSGHSSTRPSARGLILG